MSVRLLLVASCVLLPGLSLGAATAPEGLRTALARVMDQHHTSYGVYSDAFSAGNHFNARGMLGQAPAMVENCTQSPHTGLTCIKASYRAATSPYWGGWYFMNGVFPGSGPLENWGTYPSAGVDLNGATKLTFWARGESGGERVKFFCLGIGRYASGTASEPYPDSAPQMTTGFVTLTTAWTQYTINLGSADLHYVLGGFGWTTSAAENSDRDITFYLDDIAFDLPQLEEPRLLVSYRTIASSSDFDTTMRNVAFTYDNAVAVLAFLSTGDPADRQRAQLIADALVYAQEHDRYYTDGRLRNGYQGGELALPPGWITNGIRASVRMPGWSDTTGQWFEDAYVVSTSTGNVAWAMLALLGCAAQTPDGTKYVNAAARMGDWIETTMRDTRGAGGYMGGFSGDAPSPTRLAYKSTEHNLDLYAAFQRLYLITGDARWAVRAAHARRFVLSMWDPGQSLFWTGTGTDGVTTEKSVIPVDTQTWTLLALRDLASGYWASLTYAENNHRVAPGWGFDFNVDRDGIWYEGTAQMSVGYLLAGDETKASAALASIRAGAAANGAIYSSNIDGLTTGFDVMPGVRWVYYRREHVGAMGWAVLAETRTNPFWLGTKYGTFRAGWTPPPDGQSQYVNLSTRGLAGNGDNALIGGFVITGPAAATKQVLIRGVGRTLQQLGVSSALSKPRLELYQGGKMIETRRTQDLVKSGAVDPAIQQAGRQVGAFDLAASDGATGDVALLANLHPGLYTAVITPDNDAPAGARNPGVVLLELYDVSLTDGSRLANLSTRAPLGTGEQQLIVGFALRGETSAHSRALVRAVGPTLGAMGMANTATDLRFTAYDSQGRELFANDDWRTNGNADQLVQLATETGAFALGTPSKDAAFAGRLPMGNCTVVVAPASGASDRIALVEIYEAP